MKQRIASWLIATVSVSCLSCSVAQAQATSMTIDITSPTAGQLFQWNPYTSSATVNRHSDHSSVVITLIPYVSVNYSIYMDQHREPSYGTVIYASSGGTDYAPADADGNLEIPGELDSSQTYSGFSLYTSPSYVSFYATSILSANWYNSQNQL